MLGTRKLRQTGPKGVDISGARNHRERIVCSLACDYINRLESAKGQGSTPLEIGKQVQTDWLLNLKEPSPKRKGIELIDTEPRTGVSGLKEWSLRGMPRYDALLEIVGVEVWIELQSSDYKTFPKAVQHRAQMIGFAVVIDHYNKNDMYCKIIGKGLTSMSNVNEPLGIVFIWTVDEAQQAHNKEEYWSYCHIIQLYRDLCEKVKNTF